MHLDIVCYVIVSLLKILEVEEGSIVVRSVEENGGKATMKMVVQESTWNRHAKIVARALSHIEVGVHLFALGLAT